MGKKYIEIKGYEKWAGEDLSKMYQQGGAVYLENGPGLPPERVVPFELEIKGGRVNFGLVPLVGNTRKGGWW